MRAFCVLVLLLSTAADAGETVTYTYDARGRVVQVQRTGTVNNGVTTSYALDKADNRTGLTQSTATGQAPQFSIDNASANEGGPLVFTVMRIGTAAGNTGVSYATANGSATAGADYTATSGTLIFTASQTTQTVTVSTSTDGSVEASETVFINLSAPTGGATIGDGQGVGTIADVAVTNSPPVTQPDSVQVVCNMTTTVNVTANDSDPEGNTPLTLTAVVMDDGFASATVASASSVQVTGAPDNETATATYTVKDSLNASSNGTLTINSVGGPSVCE